MKRGTGWRGALVDLRRAGTPTGRAGVGCFAIEGTRLHERALRAGVQVRRCVIAESYGEVGDGRVRELLEGLEAAGAELLRAPDAEVAAMTGGRDVGAILGLVPLPPAPALEAVAEPSRAILLVAAGVTDPGNVGALVRTAHASGADAVVAVGDADPFHPRAVRISMGSLFRVPVLHVPALPPLLDRLRALGAQTVGAVSRGGEALTSARFDGRVALLMGSEAFGLSSDVVAGLDRRVTIPMGGDVDSFSVNAAAAILLYEIGRSRQG